MPHSQQSIDMPIAEACKYSIEIQKTKFGDVLYSLFPANVTLRETCATLLGCPSRKAFEHNPAVEEGETSELRTARIPLTQEQYETLLPAFVAHWYQTLKLQDQTQRLERLLHPYVNRAGSI